MDQALVLKVRVFGTRKWSIIISDGWGRIYRGYYTVARRYEFYFRLAKQYFTNERSDWVKYCFCHSKIKFIISSPRVMFFLSYRQKDIDKILEGKYQNYVIDKLRRDKVSSPDFFWGRGDVWTQAMRTVYTEILHPGLSSHEGYDGSVSESEFWEDRSLIVFFTGGDKLFVERGI